MTRAELNRLTVKELRTYARENRHLHSLTGVEIISVSKDDLVSSLAGDPAPISSGAVVDHSHSRDDLATAIARAIDGKVGNGLDTDDVLALIQEKNLDLKDEMVLFFDGLINEKIKDFTPSIHTIEVINHETGEIKDIGLQHHRFEKVMKYVQRRINVWLVGESGSGKSYMVAEIARALDLPFYPQSVGLQTSKSDLFGFVDGHGKEVRTPLRDAYEFGGVYCLDEADGGNANVLVMLNELLSNGHAIFAGTVVTKHPDFICVACANTYGKGADMVFVGRMKIDGATLNRFAFITMDIDEDLEIALAPNKEWCNRVQAIRSAVRDLKEKVLVTPRATIEGGKLAEIEPWSDLEDEFIFQGANNDVKNRILARVEGR